MHELDPKEIKRQRRWVKVFLTIALISGALALLQAVHLHFDPMAERHYGRLVHVRIADRDFAIPSEYFRGPIPRGKTNSLYLWLMMPDYTPYRGEITGNLDEIAAAWRRHIIVFVDDEASRNSFASRYTALRNGPEGIYRPQDVADVYGLHHTLVWYSNAKWPDPWIVHDLYFQNDASGQPLMFVACDRDDAAKYPGCSFHVFRDGQLTYTLNYRKANLPKWQEMQTRVRDLIESFSCVPKSNSTSTNNNNGEKICPP